MSTETRDAKDTTPEGNGQENPTPTPVHTGPTNITSAALSILAFLGIIFLLRYAQDLLIPMALAILIAYALEPPVAWVTRIGIPRVLAAAVVLCGTIAIVVAGSYALRVQAVAVIDGLPVAAQKMKAKLQELESAPGDSAGAIAKIQQAAKEIEKATAEAASSTAPPKGVTKVQIEEPAFRASAYLWSGSMGLLGLLGQAVMVAFLVFFLLGSGDLFKRKFVRIIGTKISEKRVTLEAITEINTQIERFLVIQVFTSAVVGVCTTAALWGFGVHQPAVWGLMAGIFNSVPYFGAIIVTVALAIVSFLQFDSIAMMSMVAGSAFVITSLEGFLLTPALMGRAAKINGVAMFVSLLFWSWLWGVVGMIVAVPLMMVLKSVCDRIENLQPIGELLGDR